MRTPDAVRMKRSRERRRKGLTPVIVDLSEQAIDPLQQRGYDAKRGDRPSLSRAVSALLSDLWLEAA
jgi:hypothetical protein